MYAYKETLTLTDPQILHLKQPLPLVKGQRVEVVILSENNELQSLRDDIGKRGITETDVQDAIAWARKN
jgi:hypothetical protein